MHVYLVHHGHAVDPAEDASRPLSALGRDQVRALAAFAASRGVRPAHVWHSGKLRARQTAEAFWRACNALAPCTAVRDLQPADPPDRIRHRLCGEPEDILIAGHFPHLPRLLALLVGGGELSAAGFPPHGLVALVTDDDGATWREAWRAEPPPG